tara:strand:+ start:184 stop:621 length:438 start_codon:yes stop_codon:yes gene_type:complete
MENLRNIVKNHLSEGIVIMDLVYNPISDFIKITIDSPNDIPIKETSKIAKSIKNDNNLMSMFPNGCRLEVGTPGVGTNLIEKFQFRKNIGRKIFVEYRKDGSNVDSAIFRLSSVEKNHIKVIKNKKNYIILFENIISAKVKISFD